LEESSQRSTLRKESPSAGTVEQTHTAANRPRRLGFPTPTPDHLVSRQGNA